MQENISAVLIYHKRILKKYKKNIIDNCINSIVNQSYKNFDIFEVNYGDSDYSILKDINFEKSKHFFYKKNLGNHIEALTYLLNKCFIQKNYKIAFIVNLCDFYNVDRFKNQLICLSNGYHLCSSLWSYFTEEKNNIIPGTEFTFPRFHLTPNKYASVREIRDKLNKQENLINFSGLALTQEYWLGIDEFGNKNRFRNDFLFEDLSLWTRSANAGWRLTVINKNLINYRIDINRIEKQYKNDKPDFTPRRYGVMLMIDKDNKKKLRDFMENRLRKDIKKHKHKKLFIFTNLKESLEKLIQPTKYEYFVKKVNGKLSSSRRKEFENSLDVTLEIIIDKIIWEKL